MSVSNNNHYSARHRLYIPILPSEADGTVVEPVHSNLDSEAVPVQTNRLKTWVVRHARIDVVLIHKSCALQKEQGHVDTDICDGVIPMQTI